jgi:hypothetical protein
LLLIKSYASCKIIIKISFILRAILFAFKINLRAFSGIINKKGMLWAIIIKKELNIFFALAVFINNSLISKARFSFILLAGIFARYCEFIKKGLL